MHILQCCMHQMPSTPIRHLAFASIFGPRPGLHHDQGDYLVVQIDGQKKFALQDGGDPPTRGGGGASMLVVWWVVGGTLCVLMGGQGPGGGPGGVCGCVGGGKGWVTSVCLTVRA